MPGGLSQLVAERIDLKTFFACQSFSDLCSGCKMDIMRSTLEKGEELNGLWLLRGLVAHHAHEEIAWSVILPEERAIINRLADGPDWRVPR